MQIEADAVCAFARMIYDARGSSLKVERATILQKSQFQLYLSIFLFSKTLVVRRGKVLFPSVSGHRLVLGKSDLECGDKS
jgi:hypothetical protein